MSELPEFVFQPLGEFAAAIESGAEALATGPDGGAVIPANGDALLWGPPGAGKSTVENDLVCALADGRPWLDLVHPSRPLRILLIENEGPRQEFRQKLARKLPHVSDQVGARVVVLEEPWGQFTFADPTHRAALALGLTEHEVDLLVVGPLAAVGAIGGGTPSEVREFEAYLADLRTLLGRSLAILLIHHSNKGGDVSGAYARVPDTLIHVTPQGHGRTHLHWKKVRWSSALHDMTTQLVWTDGDSYEVEHKPELNDDLLGEQILGFVAAHPGTGWNPVEKNTPGVSKERRREIRDRLLAEGRLVNVVTEDGEEVLLDAVRPRETARLYLSAAPEVATLRRASGAAPAQPELAPDAQGQLRLRRAPLPKEGAEGAGAAQAPDEDAQ